MNHPYLPLTTSLLSLALSFSTLSGTASGQGGDLPKNAVGRLGSPNLRQVGSVGALLYMAEGKTLLSAGNDTIVHVWDATTGLERGRFGVPSTGVHALTATEDSEWIYAASVEGTVTRVARTKLDTPEVLKLYGSLAVASPNHQFYCTANEDGVSFNLFDAKGNMLRAIESRGARTVDATFSPDSSLLALSTFTFPEDSKKPKQNKIALVRIVRVQATAENEEVKTLTLPGGVFFKRVAFLPGNQKLIAGGVDGLIRLIDINTGVIEPTVQANPTGVSEMVLSHDASLVATGGDNGDVLIFSTDKLQLLQSFTAHRGRILSLAFTPDNKRIASGADDAVIRVHDVATGEAILGPNGHDSIITAVATSPDGSLIATGAGDGSFRIWDGADFACTRIGEPIRGAVYDMEFSPTETVVALCAQDGRIQIIDPIAGVQLKRIEGARVACQDIAYFPDGNSIAAVYEDKQIHVFDSHTGKVIRSFAFATKSWPQSIAVSRDGKWIAAGSSEIHLFTADGEKKLEITSCRAPVGALLFDRTNSLLIAGLADGTIRAFDPATGEEKRRFEGSQGRVESLSLSPDGALLASAGIGEPQARVWSIETGKLIETFAGHDDNVSAVAFLGKDRVVSVASDMLGIVWKVNR